MGSKVRVSLRFIGVCILVVLGVSLIGVVGWVRYGPEHNVRMWLDKKDVDRGAPLKLHIRNLGSKNMGFGAAYQIFREYDNGTIERWKWPSGPYEWAWPAVEHIIWPFVTHSENIYTDLEPGYYYVVKKYHVSGPIEYSKKLYFIIVS